MDLMAYAEEVSWWLLRCDLSADRTTPSRTLWRRIRTVVSSRKLSRSSHSPADLVNSAVSVSSTILADIFEISLYSHGRYLQEASPQPLRRSTEVSLQSLRISPIGISTARADAYGHLFCLGGSLREHLYCHGGHSREASLQSWRTSTRCNSPGLWIPMRRLTIVVTMSAREASLQHCRCL